MSVLVCTDFSAAAAVGEREAAHRFPGTRLVMFHAVDPRLVGRVTDLTGMDAAKLSHNMRDYADQRLVEIVNRLTSQGRDVIPDLVEGSPVEEALVAAARHDASLIVLGARAGVEVGRFRTRLLRQARLPVLLIPAAE